MSGICFLSTNTYLGIQDDHRANEIWWSKINKLKVVIFECKFEFYIDLKNYLPWFYITV